MTARVVILSGGSRGLGAAVVQDLLDAGDNVATFSRDASEQTNRWQSETETAGRFLYQSIDAADETALRKFVAQTHHRFGQIDVLINNAAVAIDGVLATTDDESVQNMLSVNLAAAIHLSRECARLMLLRQQGVILNVASAAAERGVAGLAVYSATKAGVIGLTRSLARELGPKGIRVNAIAPGYLETDMSKTLTTQQRERVLRQTPLGRLGTVDDVRPWIKLLISDAGSFVTGQVITIDGGASV